MKLVVKLALLCALTFFAMPVAFAQPGTADLVKDIMPGMLPSDSDASEFLEMNGILYYSGYHPATGYELWRTDGTEAGTWMVKDVLDGPDGSEPKDLTISNGYIYFLARADTNAYRLWRTDGTKDGTVRLLTGSPYIAVTNLYISSAGRLYLEATTSAHEHLLLSSDGTAEGTVVLTQLAPHLSVAANFLGDSGAVTLFTMRDGFDPALWRTDGTAAGTARISMPPSVTQFGSHGVELHGHLYFPASGGLWKTNGTAAGTELLVPAYLRITGNQDPLVKMGNMLFFSATNNLAHQLWKSDGTAEGTYLVNENQTGVDPYNFTVSNGLLYYTARKAASFPNGGSVEIWRSDGTAAGTFPLTNFNTPGQTMPAEMAAAGDQLFFRTYENGDLYATDGTVTGTRLVKSFEAVSEGYHPWPTAALGNAAIFTAEGGTGRDLWLSDGTAEGTRLIYEPRGAQDSEIIALVNVGNKWFFSAVDGEHGREPWVSDGTPEGTFMLKDIWPGYNPSLMENVTFATLNGKVYFAANNGTYGIELWESDGTEAGTRMLKDIEPGAGWSNPVNLVSSGGRLFFVASTSAAGREIWISDGTEAGTHMAAPQFPFPQQSPQIMAAMNGEVYFTCADYESADSYYPTAYLFYKTDGTAEGTTLLTHLEAASTDMYPGQQTAVLGDTLLFPWKSNGNGVELWKTDGTPAGTKKVRDFGTYGQPQYLTTLANYAYFCAFDQTQTLKLWRTDGTAEGTAVVSHLTIGGFGDSYGLVAHNGKLYFTIESATDAGLWSYNPVNGITHRIHHLLAKETTSAGNWLLYAANDGINGYEPWKTNGTPDQTSMVQDIFPGGSSAPEQITPGPGKILFTAKTAEHGRELWSLELKNLLPAAAAGWQLYE